MFVKGIGQELRKRAGNGVLGNFENDKVGFKDGDAVAIAGQPGRDGVYAGLKDSVGTMRII